ncbi:hypothetical protein MAPG_08480 [Magnaporthiopsis poae ATCC 64411]|uniref:Aminoglycoside phosphotransferase domain-containing protein n=1 Tax=Magnaporthiopsis poae (strain ATCC 64411 / 73-15) TaxID=644358 RepID=A0A0C4E7G7_MAGP6|nr:hypothetical protein MAPG_08480 [Magnaporthiopsis poae ATCC 64411]
MAPWDKLEGWHNGSEALAINNTRTRRILTRLAVRATRLLRPKSCCGSCVSISKRLVVKTGLMVHLEEAAAMRFVAEHAPGVPVPRVHCAFVHKDMAYIVQDRVQGEMLASVWKRLRSDDQAWTNVLGSLRRILEELRSIKPPPGAGVQSSTGGSLRDPRNTRAFPRMGPFKSVQEFHVWLRDGLQPPVERPDSAVSTLTDDEWRELDEMVALQDAKPEPELVFTHGDLNLANIMIIGDKVSGIIDWETAGFYPDYWEYTSAFTVSFMIEEWQKDIDKFLQPYPDALRMERTRRRWWGEI